MKKEDIKSFEDACKALGIDPVTSIPDVSNTPEHLREAVTGHYKMMIVAEAINGTWKPNWNDGSWKYWPWFEVVADETRPSGSRLSYDVYDGGYSDTTVGSRLCFKDSETAEYVGRQFAGLYETFFLK